MNRALLIACVSAFALLLVGCGQSQQVSLREEDLAGFKGHPAEKPAQSADSAEAEQPQNQPPPSTDDGNSPPAGLAPNPSARTEDSPSAAPGLQAPTSGDPEPRRMPQSNRGPSRASRPVDRSESADFTIGGGARVVVQGVFKIVSGKIVAWKPDGTSNPALQKEIGDQFEKISKSMRDGMKPMMDQLEQAIFVVSDVEGSTKPGVVRPDFGGGFGGGGIMSMMMMGARARMDGRVVCMAEAPKEGNTVAIRYRVSEKDPMTGTIPFKAGASASMGSGTVTLQAINDGPPASSPPPRGRDGGRMGTPTSHIIFAKSGLPRDPFSIQLIGKDGKPFTLVDKDGKPFAMQTRPASESQWDDMRNVRPAFRTMGNDGDTITIGLIVKRDLIESVKLTIVPETIIERTGIAARPK